MQMWYFINKQKKDDTDSRRKLTAGVKGKPCCPFFIFLFSCLILLLLGSCTEVIDLDLESTTQKLVVDGMITSEQKMHYLRLTKSVPFFEDSASPAISDAEVIISDGYSSTRLTEVAGSPGYYVTPNDFYGIPGYTYSLSISGVDIDNDGQEESYSATSYMPFVSGPDSIDLIYDSGWEIWKVLLYATEDTATEDYYLFRLLKNGILISDNISEYSVVSDKFFDEGRANGIWVQSIDAGSGGQKIETGDIITLQMCGITEKYFKYIEAVQRENRGKYPIFSGPPANAPGNINNDALGFFPALSVSYKSYRFR